MTFGEKLQKIRKEAGYSQEDLSFKLQVSRQAVSKWENDQGYPEIDKIIKMADIFDVTLDYFFNGSERSKEHTSELQSRFDLVCRLLLEKKKQRKCMLTTQ